MNMVTLRYRPLDEPRAFAMTQPTFPSLLKKNSSIISAVPIKQPKNL